MAAGQGGGGSPVNLAYTYWWLILCAQFLKIAEAEDGVEFDYDDDDEGDDHEREE